MNRNIEDGMGCAGLVGLSRDEREIERLSVENKKMRADARRCFHLGPRIPMIQHERPTCELSSGHTGKHLAHVGRDLRELGWFGTCPLCGGSGQLFDTKGHGPWDCYACRAERDSWIREDPLNDESLQLLVNSPNFRDYEKAMARELLRLRSSETDLNGSKDQNSGLVRAALLKFVTAAKSWHDTHGHGSNPVQCDWLCECIAPAEAALSATK